VSPVFWSRATSLFVGFGAALAVTVTSGPAQADDCVVAAAIYGKSCGQLKPIKQTPQIDHTVFPPSRPNLPPFNLGVNHTDIVTGTSDNNNSPVPSDNQPPSNNEPPLINIPTTNTSTPPLTGVVGTNNRQYHGTITIWPPNSSGGGELVTETLGHANLPRWTPNGNYVFDITNIDITHTYTPGGSGNPVATPNGDHLVIQHSANSTTVTIISIQESGTSGYVPCSGACTTTLLPGPTKTYGTPSRLGGPLRISLFDNSGGFAGFGASASRSNGYRITDSAGLISTQNALTPGYRSIDSGGGVNLSFDATHALGLAGNQKLWLDLTGTVDTNFATLSATPLALGGANDHAGSTQQTTYTLAGSVKYEINDLYFIGSGMFDVSHAKITNNALPGTQGQTSGNGFAVGVEAGRIFPLVNTTGLRRDMMLKAPSRTPGGYALFLDASGHYLFSSDRLGGYADSTGFVYGALRESYSDVGGRLRLIALVPDRDFAWMPFIGATFDQQLGLKQTLDIPAQAATAADTLIFSPATTFWGAEAGLDLLTRGNSKFGIKAFYQASADTQSVGGTAFLRIPFEDFTGASDNGIRVLPLIGMPVKAPPPAWAWAGLYFGPHLGGVLSLADFSDPFGPSIYGDAVRSPGFLGGGQIGYNWQLSGSPWVLGVEADGSLIDSDGSNTCFAASTGTVNSTCRVRPSATATLTARAGYAFGPGGRTLAYAKGGLAWIGDSIDMALNAAGTNVARAAAPVPFRSQNVGLWGETVGIGIEHALTPAWSLKAEYDYLHFGNVNVANLGTVSIPPVPPFIIGVVPPGVSSVSQDLHEIKLGLNYKWGASPWAPGWTAAPPVYASLLPGAGWEIEGGGRYFASWGQFKKTFGLIQSIALPPTSDLSRLTYDGMQSHSGEFFGRIETPWNVFVKGYVGGGSTDNGHMNDEDNVLQFGSVVAAYSNTLSPAVDGNIRYGTIDVGYDVLRGDGYKAGAFVGYFRLKQQMNAFGCAAIASPNCPNGFQVPTSGFPVVTENDTWSALRLGVSAEAMLTSRIKISADAAWLPRVHLDSVDQHFISNTGALAELIPASGNGRGVQVEAVASYYITPRWSVGVGARYWGLWTSPNGQLSFTFPPPATAPQYFRAQVEQLGAFVQTSYKFDWAARWLN